MSQGVDFSSAADTLDAVRSRKDANTLQLTQKWRQKDDEKNLQDKYFSAVLANQLLFLLPVLFFFQNTWMEYKEQFKEMCWRIVQILKCPLIIDFA